MKIALALIVKNSEDEAIALSQCLAYTARYVDGIFITITSQENEAKESLKKICSLFRATVSYFEWTNNFAAARNYNFSTVPKDYDYILWLDADDAVRGLEKLKETIKKHPADAYSFFYLYAFDENKNPTVVHAKTQVVKNDGCVEWVGRLHEDFKENRTLTRFHIDGIERIHLSTKERYDSAKKRNLEIALEQLRDEPDDPRSLWNVGNCYVACANYEKADEYLSQFLKDSRSDDEKYIARLRLAEVLWTLGRKQEAIEHAQAAIGIKPNFPDAYFTLGSLYSQSNQLQKSIELYLTGLTKPRPYHKIIVYNPRDYDYVPMMELAKVYFKLSRPDLALPLLEGCSTIYPNDKSLKQTIKLIKKEVVKFEAVVKILQRLSKIKDKAKLKREFEKIPDEFKSHPGICNLRNLNFLKTESSGRDLVIYCGHTEEEWTPETIKEKGIGGSEEAVYHLSNLLAEKGWNVTVYNNCGHRVQKFGQVTYAPYWTWNYKDKQDIVIIWRTPIYLDFDINCDKIFVDLHDVLPAAEFTESRIKKIKKIFVKSKFQRDLFPHVPDEKFVIIPNGIEPEKFTKLLDRDSKLIINTSAPNRGIAVLTEMFAEIKKEVPDARLQWYYGWFTFDKGFEGDEKVAKWKADLQKRMKEVGVEDMGRINHDQIAEVNLKANVWAYPSGFGEIDCISLTKAMAAGAIPVTTDFAALGEKAGHGGFFAHSDLTSEDWWKPTQFDFSVVDPRQIKEMTQAIIKLLKNSPSEDMRQGMRDWAKKTFDWKVIAQKWDEVLNG
jgi:glycosyltransferase involved in cell wall biosynthesis